MCLEVIALVWLVSKGFFRPWGVHGCLGGEGDRSDGRRSRGRRGLNECERVLS